MMPLAALLENKTFARYFEKTPHLHPVQQDGRLAWRVWIQQTPDSPWRRKDVVQYSTGVRLIHDRLDDVYDAALQCRGRAYEPPTRVVRLTRDGEPVVRVGGDGKAAQVVQKVTWTIPPDLTRDYGQHLWCYYCRRPTVFTFFASHHAFRGTSLEAFTNADVRRCTLCGISINHIRSAP